MVGDFYNPPEMYAVAEYPRTEGIRLIPDTAALLPSLSEEMDDLINTAGIICLSLRHPYRLSLQSFRPHTA